MKKIDTEEGSDIVMEKLSPEEPWYLDTDVNWYIENHSQSYYKAVELSRLLQDIINYSDADKTEYIIRKAAELGMSQRTLYRHMDKYLEAAGWALKMLRETGANYDYYKVLCLCRKPKDSNTFPTFTPEWLAQPILPECMPLHIPPDGRRAAGKRPFPCSQR